MSSLFGYWCTSIRQAKLRARITSRTCLSGSTDWALTGDEGKCWLRPWNITSWVWIEWSNHYPLRPQLNTTWILFLCQGFQTTNWGGTTSITFLLFKKLSNWAGLTFFVGILWGEIWVRATMLECLSAACSYIWEGWFLPFYSRSFMYKIQNSKQRRFKCKFAF